MKTEHSLSKSARSRLKQAINELEIMSSDLQSISLGFLDPQQGMPGIRARLALITQCVHEFNAYNNALTTA